MRRAWLAACLVGGAAGILCGDAFAGQSLRFKNANHDFGAITETAKKPHAFGFRNTGGKTVRITSVTPSCGCTAALPDKKEYKPGEEGAINATFDPAGHPGKQETTVIVEDDGGGKYVLTLKADIKAAAPSTVKLNLPAPVIAVTPEKVDLGAIPRGKAAIFQVVVENKGDGDLYIRGYTTPNDDGVSLSAIPIKKGKKIELTLFYMPPREGKIDDFVAIRSNDPKRPEVRIHLTGTASGK